MTKEQINEEAIKYCSHIDFTNDKCLNEKGREKVAEWCKQDFIAGANYVMKQLILSGVIKSVCENCNKPVNTTIEYRCDNCKTSVISEQTVL